MDHEETIEEAAGAGADSARLDALERVALADRRNTVSVALDAAREVLGMDVAYVTELTPDWQLATAVSRAAARSGREASGSRQAAISAPLSASGSKNGSSRPFTPSSMASRTGGVSDAIT